MKWEQPAWPRFLPSRVVLNLATLGPVGRRLPAPGTWGSVAGLVYFTVVFWPLYAPGAALPDLASMLLSLLGIAFAIGICGQAELQIGRKDPGEVILDEFVAMPLCFLGFRSLESLPIAGWIVPLAGLGLFRLFDIAKPFGIRRLQNLPQGWGIVVDDVAAALAACATMHVARWVYLAV
jgi:phosphatidylglycerophosphatase A